MTSARDWLIVLSAVTSVVKSFVSVNTYEYWNVVFAVGEMALTAVAFVIVLLDDEFTIDTYGRQDYMIFLVMFLQGLMAEWIDVIATFNTVRLFKELQAMPGKDTELMKKDAGCQYVKGLIFGLLFTGLLPPLLTFSKADWDVDLFEPGPFSYGNSDRLIVASWIGFAQSSFVVIFYTLFPMLLGKTVVGMLLNAALYPAMVVVAVLMLISIARIKSTAEAGHFTFLLCINAVQMAEMSAEYTRLSALREEADRMKQMMAAGVGDEGDAPSSDEK